jgi:hypothetical protein
MGKTGRPIFFMFGLLLLLFAGTNKAVTAQQHRPIQRKYPWLFPGDFNQRVSDADLVVAGIIRSTSASGKRTVDGVELTANVAEIDVDRVFKGQRETVVRFTWFTFPPMSGGIVYSGPPISNLRIESRYLIFLRKRDDGWAVTIPLWALEVKLAPARPTGALLDLTQVPEQTRNQAMAEELETAALRMPKPAPGVTGEAAMYFPWVFDLVGGCGESFFRLFLSSDSKELREASQNWLALLINKHSRCVEGVPILNR